MTENQEPTEQLRAKIEALLYVYGEAMHIKKIATICEASLGEVAAALLRLGEDLKSPARGLMLILSEERYQLVTKPDFADLLQVVIKEEFAENLTPAALEALTIVTYSGPITRAEIDYIRGVNSSFIMRALMIRGLIERVTDEKRGNAFLYGPSFELLKRLGVARVQDLPEYGHFSGLLKKMNQPSEALTGNNEDDAK